MDCTLAGAAGCCDFLNSRRTRAKVFRKSVSTLGVYRNEGSRMDFMEEGPKL